jgi:hypothetical protein
MALKRIRAANLRVVVLDLPRAEVVQRLDLDLVDHGVEDPLPRPVAGADEDGHDHTLLVLRGLVAEPDRRGLPSGTQLLGHHRVVEVEGVQRLEDHTA